MGIIAKPIGYLLMLIYNLVGNYGVSLIILTFIVKLVLYPLYAKQITSSANMQAMSERHRIFSADTLMTERSRMKRCRSSTQRQDSTL